MHKHRSGSNLEFLPVSFYVAGQRLFGSLHIPYIGAPCIIALHGLESNKDSGKWPIIASRLFKDGYACLRFNFRGCGEGSEKSEGMFEDTSLTSRIEDFKAAIDFLYESAKVNVKRLGAIGSSFGGMVAIAAGGERIKAIVTISTPIEISGLGKPQPSKEGVEYALPSGMKLKANFYEDLQKYNLLDAVRKAPPILFIHGSLDELVPQEHAIKLYEAACEPKKIEIIKGADHAFSNEEHLNKAIELAIK